MVRRHQSPLRKHLQKSDVRKGPRVFHLCTDQRYTWSCPVWIHQTVVHLCRSWNQRNNPQVSFPQVEAQCRVSTTPLAPTVQGSYVSLPAFALPDPRSANWMTHAGTSGERKPPVPDWNSAWVCGRDWGEDNELVSELIKAKSPTRQRVSREDGLCSKSPRLLCLLMIEIGRIFGWELKLGQHGLGRASETSVYLSHA